MSLQWEVASGAWLAYDEPPGLVHGVGFIRAAGPSICLYADDGALRLQVDTQVFELSGTTPRISCARSLFSLGLRRNFRLQEPQGVVFSHGYWASRQNDFFVWLASVARQPDWRRRTAERWTVGLSPAVLREEVNPPAPRA
jgi:hypothetical protein